MKVTGEFNHYKTAEKEHTFEEYVEEMYLGLIINLLQKRANSFMASPEYKQGQPLLMETKGGIYWRSRRSPDVAYYTCSYKGLE